MQVLGAFHKRKSFDKLEPEMPKRKISGISRSDSKRKHRTEHKSINSPQVELNAYKRKNMAILNDLEATYESDEKQSKAQLRTDRTKQQSYITQTSLIQENRKAHNYREKQILQQKNSKNQRSLSKNINREELTSRFTISHNDVQDVSLTSLITLTKSKSSNPLINTARLKQQSHQQSNPFASVDCNNRVQSQNFKPIKNQSVFDQGESPKLRESDLNNITFQNNFNMHSQLPHPIEQNQHQQNNEEIDEGQNFDGYEFGGQNFNDSQYDHSIRNNKKSERQLMPPPKVQSYKANDLTKQKPLNWRQMNRYIPSSEEQQRMNQQLLKKQKASLQAKRQQQEIFNLIKEYQQNKNSIHLVSQRKTQTNKIIQKIYRDKRVHSEGKNSVSLPQLKSFSQPKKLISIPEANSVYSQIREKTIEMEDCTNPKSINQINKNIRVSLSYSKLGFGSSKSRLLNQEQLNQTELEGIYQIQKKLRQKGVQFNTAVMRKGLLGVREIPIYKLSTKNSPKTQHQEMHDKEKLNLPQKQLPSNDYYKIFPL